MEGNFPITFRWNLTSEECTDRRCCVRTSVSHMSSFSTMMNLGMELMEEWTNATNVNSLNIIVPEYRNSSISMDLSYFPRALRQCIRFQFAFRSLWSQYQYQITNLLIKKMSFCIFLDVCLVNNLLLPRYDLLPIYLP